MRVVVAIAVHHIGCAYELILGGRQRAAVRALQQVRVDGLLNEITAVFLHIVSPVRKLQLVARQRHADVRAGDLGLPLLQRCQIIEEGEKGPAFV